MLGSITNGLWDLSFHSLPFMALPEYWIIYAIPFVATCLVGWHYKAFHLDHLHDKPKSAFILLQSFLPFQTPFRLQLGDILPRIRRRRPPVDPSAITSPDSSPGVKKMRYTRQSRFTKKTLLPLPVASAPPLSRAKQPYEAFLILDVEATCQEGTDFSFPNEIIEFPVCLMRWKDKSTDHRASQLEIVDEFRSFVRPTWHPTLSRFCTELTGITQEQVDSAPPFPIVLSAFQSFLVKHGLIDEETGERLIRFCWCSDGPFDIRDFVVKQCFISKISMPGWMQGDIFDVRTSVMDWLHSREQPRHAPSSRGWDGPKRRTLNIAAQLKALGLPGFEGRQHSGIDDSRNVARIVAELAKNGLSLHPNTPIYPNRRWQWMGKHGQILEGYWTINQVEIWKTQ